MRASSRRSPTRAGSQSRLIRERPITTKNMSRAREFEMSSRAPVSSRAILFSSRGGDLPRAQASVVRSV